MAIISSVWRGYRVRLCPCPVGGDAQMTYKPPFVVWDVETEENGHGSTEFYREAFRVTSAAFSWIAEDGSIKSEFVLGEGAVLAKLERIVIGDIPVVAHNAQFEMGCLLCRFPRLEGLRWLADTMRLVQVYDNGGDPLAFEYVETLDDLVDAIEMGDEERKVVFLAGLGLVKSCMRILKLPDHKKEAHEWIRANVPECRNGKEGGYLNRLPSDILERYNVGDTEYALKLFVHTTEHFNKIGYDWKIDHGLYFSSVKRIVEAKVRGVHVDRESLSAYRQSIDSEIEGIGAAFKKDFAAPISAVERDRLLSEVRKRKTFKGRKKFVARLKGDPIRYAEDIGFNVGSNKQLASLFVTQLGMVIKFKTDSGLPSFRSAVLHQWGDGGSMLKLRRKRMLVMKQCDSLLALTEYDGRWHVDLKACGTSTGRFAGGSNV